MSFARAERPVVGGVQALLHRFRWLRDGHISIRLRLTLLYSAILALALIVFGGTVYAVVQELVLSTADTALINEARSLDPGRLLSMSQSGSGFPGVRGDADNGVVPPGTYVQILDINGNVLRKPAGLGGHLLPFSASDLARIKQAPHHELRPVSVMIDGQHMLLYSYIAPGSTNLPAGPGGSGRPGTQGNHGPAPPGGPGSGGNNIFAQARILELAQTLKSQDDLLTALRIALIAGGLIVIVLAFGAGWMLAGTALRPIARLTQTAQRIGESRDFGQRVAHKGPRDEVGRLAVTFNTMLANLQEAYQRQRRFVADASHELRTPLTTIRGNLGLLQREPPISSEDRQAVLGDLVSESERLSRLVGDLLTLARTDSGRPLRREPVPIKSLLADLTRRLEVSQAGRPIERNEVANVAVVGDADAVTQILLILLDNALKFTPADGTVSVSARAAAGYVIIAVRDTGPGIDPEALPHIFDRFYQGDTARAGSGTGLGLSIAKALVDALQGEIAVESVVGRGSVFTVSLPQARVPVPVAVS